MAITVQQSPTYFNIANNHLVYVVTSDQTSQPQYQFVLDIKDKDGNLVQRLKQQPNPSNKGVFDIGHLISSQFGGHIEYLNPDDTITNDDGYIYPVANSYRTNGQLPYSIYYTFPSLNNGAAKQFNVYFGEEYGTSTTSVVTLYDGEGSTGNPAVSPTTEWEIYSQGVLDINTRYPVWNADWNLTNAYDTYFADAPIVSGSVTSQVRVTEGKNAKWAPQRFYGNVYNAGGTQFETPSLTEPPMPLYGLHVGLTDFPITRSIQWDDYATLSVFHGTDIDPAKIDEAAPQSSSLFIPKFQWIAQVDYKFYDADGTTSTRSNNFGDGAIRARVLDNDPSLVTSASFGYDPMYYWVSQSVEDTLLHFGVGPMNFGMSDPTDGMIAPFKDPINNPNNYTLKYDVIMYGASLSNACSYTNMKWAGRERSGYLTPERGSLGYSVPTTVLSDAGNPTGSYDVGTAQFVIRAGAGGECITRINFADILYSPEAEFPCASVLAIQDCINRDMIASGSSARAFLTDMTQDEIERVPDDFKEAHDEKYWKYKLVIMDHGSNETGGNICMVLDDETNPSADHLGQSLVGSNSNTGLATGLWTGTSNSNTFGMAAGTQISFGSNPENQYNSTFEIRTYEVDWSGFPGHYEDCGYEKKQFYWVNKYGVYDYFTFTKAETITDDIERKDYKQTFVDFSSNTNTIDFNKSRRGRKQFQNKPTQRHRVESDWLTQEEADAVREMFFSANVYYLEKQITKDLDYLFRDSQTGVPQESNLKSPQNMGDSNVSTYDQIQELPVVITNATLTEKTNPRTDKLYRYTVEYQLANELNSRV